MPLDGGAPAPPVGCPLDNVGCHLADVDFHHRDALFDEVMLDTGWVPPGSPVQVRFALFLGGETEVDLGGTAVTSWPPSLDVAVPGREGTGRLRMSYGLEIVARIRFDVDVAGIGYTWEGDIPIGDIPRDLRLADELVFDPFVLPPQEPRPVTVWDNTDRVTVLTVDLTDAIIPIPGIGGGFLVDAEGALEGAYRTDRIEVSDAVGDIEMEGASVVVRPDPGSDGLGAAKDLTILPHGTIGYDGVITLFPTLFIEIAGRRFDLVLTEVDVPVVDFETETDFDPAEVHVPLPDIRVDPTSLRFEAAVGEDEEQLLTIFNDGEAELVVMAGDPSGPFIADMPALTLGPSTSGRLPVRFAPGESGDFTGVLLISSNDPDEPLVTVQLFGLATGGSPDAGLGLDAGLGAPVDGGCGCRTIAGDQRGWAWPVLLGVLVAARRRRRHR